MNWVFMNSNSVYIEQCLCQEGLLNICLFRLTDFLSIFINSVNLTFLTEVLKMLLE